MEKKYKCTLNTGDDCFYSSSSGACSHKLNCVWKKDNISCVDFIQKYKSKLLNHLLWIDENVEHMSHTEKMLFDLHLSVLKDIIKDLEEMK